MSQTTIQRYQEDVPLIPKFSPFYNLACIDYKNQTTYQSAKDVLSAVFKTLKEERTKSKTELACDAIQIAADMTKIGIEIAGYAADTTKNTVAYTAATTKHILIDTPINMTVGAVRIATAPVGFFWRVAKNSVRFQPRGAHRLTEKERREKAHKRTKRKNEQKRRKHRRIHEQELREEEEKHQEKENFRPGKAARTPETTFEHRTEKTKSPEEMIGKDLEQKGERYQPAPLESFVEKMDQPQSNVEQPKRREKEQPKEKIQRKKFPKASSERKAESLLWFNQIGDSDVELIGGKNASLGEMFRSLVSKGVNVPNGFAVTVSEYFKFLDQNNIREKIQKELQGLNLQNTVELDRRSLAIRTLILKGEFSDDLKRKITDAYNRLAKDSGIDNVTVAIRSSATSEDLPEASFAGLQESYLNISGAESIIFHVRKCMASLFTSRAISYRQQKGFDHFRVGISVGVQRMVRSDQASSGVMFTLDTESGFKDVVLITGCWGLGENVVQGKVDPDEFLVFKPTLLEGKRPIIEKKLGSKLWTMENFDVDKIKLGLPQTETTRNLKTTDEKRHKFCLSENEVLLLAQWGMSIEDHYSKAHQKYTPMDIEWAKDGITNELFIVQARPETVHSQRDWGRLHQYVLKENNARMLIAGTSVGTSIGCGPVKIIRNPSEMSNFKDGEVLVTKMTDPDWEPILSRASAIVTEEGGRTCHAAIVSRELGIPCVVGCRGGMTLLQNGQTVTIDCSGGEQGRVLEGKVEFEIKDVELSTLPKLKTKLMLNVADPRRAFELSFIPNSGVGLARMEFTINNYIKCHPMAVLHPERTRGSSKSKIKKATYGYDSPTEFFVQHLAQGIGMIGAAFYPKPVIVRFSDFKTNEYANLLGGETFEPKESNPMLGWRGASRYYHPGYKEAFALECQAIKKVREVFGLTNVQVMVPFVRTLEEGKKVLEEMAANGLVKHENDLRVIAMCEVPTNVILASEMLEIFDGFSIGSNDLTQLTLGVDRDSAVIHDLFDERNEAVRKLISHVIETGRNLGRYVGICGEAPSNYPEFAEFLVESGIHSISLSPDVVLRTIEGIHSIEQKLAHKDLGDKATKEKKEVVKEELPKQQEAKKRHETMDKTQELQKHNLEAREVEIQQRRTGLPSSK